MRKASHFVVPIDVSPGMGVTLSTALALASGCGARVDVLEVIPDRRPSLLGDDADFQLANQQSSRQGWSRMADTIESARRRRIDVRTIAYRGNAIKIVTSHAHLAKATLIVVDQHYGTSRWRRNTRVVNDLARSAPIPVLVLPTQRRLPKDGTTSFRHILSAVDLTVASAVALRTVLDLVRRTGAKLTLVHALANAPDHMVFASGEGAKIRRHLQSQTANVAERLRNKIPANVGIDVDVRVTTGDPHRGILTVASEVDADLVVMGVPPRSRIDEVLFGSTLQRVLRRTKIPLLVVPVPAGAYKWLDETDGIELPLPAKTRQHANKR
jgi:nucleotide-binding universal stress UspA family protein